MATDQHTSKGKKALQRIPFGKRGIKDGNGRIIRTDHMTMSDVISDIGDSGPTRQEILDKRIQRAVDGDILSLKKRQDEFAGNTRRKA